MEEGRIQSSISRKPPRVVLDKRDRRFNFAKDLIISDAGYLDVVLEIKSMKLVMDSDDNERLTIGLSIIKAEPYKEKENRT